MNRACGVLAAVVFLLSTSAALPDTMAEVKSSADWMQVTVEGILTYALPDECYIEATDRSGGIWVQAPTTGFAVGDPVIAIGNFCSQLLGEPIVLDASLYPYGRPAAIRPFGMKNATIGGAPKWSPMWISDLSRQRVLEDHAWTWHYSWIPVCGPTNTGLLVKIWGTVKALYQSLDGTRWLYVDDGSSVVTDYGDVGVLVYSNAEVNRGDFVSVQGISSCEPSLEEPDRLIRVIRTRDAADVVVLKDSESERPFSDEFDKPTLDQHWGVVPGSGSVSTSAEPGWLSITAQPQLYTGWLMPMVCGPQVVQYAPGDWDLEIKVRDQLWQTPGLSHNLYIVLKNSATDPIFMDPCCVDLLADTSHEGFGYCEPPQHKAFLGFWLYNGVMPDDTAYFRLCRRGLVVSANVSFDGTNYLSQDIMLETNGFDWLSLFTRSSYNPSCTSTGVPFTSYIDYVRFTPVGQGGSQ